MSDIQEPTEIERAARFLARAAKVDADHLATAEGEDAERIMALAVRQRDNVNHRASMHEWRLSSLIVTGIGGAMNGVGALAQATLTDNSGLVHLHAALLHPLMVVPTLVVAATGIVCQARHTASQLSINGINRRVLRLAASHARRP